MLSSEISLELSLAEARRTALFGDQKHSSNLWTFLARESLLLLEHGADGPIAKVVDAGAETTHVPELFRSVERTHHPTSQRRQRRTPPMHNAYRLPMLIARILHKHDLDLKLQNKFQEAHYIIIPLDKQ
jgi:hypothetical protein